MRCPCCQSEMNEVPAGSCRVDCCPRCGGVWFDHRELARLSDREPAALIALGRPGTVPQPPAVADRRCPRCQAPFQAFQFGGSQDITADRCERCHGIWLDGGELRQVCAHLGIAAAGSAERPARGRRRAAAEGGGGWLVTALDAVTLGDVLVTVLGLIVEGIFDW